MQFAVAVVEPGQFLPDEIQDALVLLDAQDFTGRTAFRIAEGSKQSFQFQEWPETAEFLNKIGANVSLGISGREQLRQDEREAQKKAGGAQ